MAARREQDRSWPGEAPLPSSRTRPITVLVTGFGPFPGVRVNPTATLARAIAARIGRGGAPLVTCAVFTVSYGRALAELAAADKAHRPDAILLLGLAARARQVRVERFARGLDSPLHPDATGQGGRGTGRGGFRRAATVAPEPPLATLRRAGIRAALSPTAGRYLCNAVYYAALERARGRPVLFVHVPTPKPAPGRVPAGRVAPWRPDARRLAPALAAIAAALARAARRPEMAHRRLA